MKTIYKTILIFLFLAGCKAPQPVLQNKDLYTLLNLHYEGRKQKEVAIFHKTINEDWVEIKDRMRFGNLNANISISGKRIDFEDLITQEDLNFLKGQTEDLRRRKIDPQYLNFSVNLVRKKDTPNTLRFSEPFFTQNKKFAFIFRGEARGAESFIVFQKTEGQWSFLCEVILVMV